jgi:hypothetical protein
LTYTAKYISKFNQLGSEYLWNQNKVTVFLVKSCISNHEGLYKTMEGRTEERHCTIIIYRTEIFYMSEAHAIKKTCASYMQGTHVAFISWFVWVSYEPAYRKFLSIYKIYKAEW